MIEDLVYSKHNVTQHCGVAYFSAIMAEKLSAEHVQTYKGFKRCKNFFINLDIIELDKDDINHLFDFIKSDAYDKAILIMHDYRFSYLEDKLIDACDIIVNLSGEEELNKISGNNSIGLFTPSLIDAPVLSAKKGSNRPMSLSFGFFSPRKKSFNKYLKYYDYMLTNYADWYHIIVMSSHVGTPNVDIEILPNLLNSDSIVTMEFIPNKILSELISLSDLGVSFYPTGILSNNAAPMSFFQQGKTVVTSSGKMTPPSYHDFIINWDKIELVDFDDLKSIHNRGKAAQHYYDNNLNWDYFIKKIKSLI
jgi:hypothetical protein